MTTVDQLLTRINRVIPISDAIIPYQDRKLLQSLTEYVVNDFITENQSKLLLKVLNEHYDILKGYDDEFEDVLANPSWSNEFRQLEHYRKVYIGEVTETSEKIIYIKFSYLHDYRTIMGGLWDINIKPIQNNYYSVPLTESNIVTVHEVFMKKQFTFCDEFMEYFNIITSWDPSDYCNIFTFENVQNEPHIVSMLQDIGECPEKDLLICDKRIKYQFSAHTHKLDDDLASMIAFRYSHRMWISSAAYSIADMITALHRLRRTKILFTFDKHDSNTLERYMQELSAALDSFGITDHVGIYFRLPSSVSKNFNSLISEKKYNCKLDVDTTIVGIDSAKPPKFLLTSEWKPDAIISVNSNPINGKTAVYSSRCDLTIVYTVNEPIIKQRVI